MFGYLTLKSSGFVYFFPTRPNVYGAKTKKHKVDTGNENPANSWLRDAKQK